tara:strand:- start:1484 stop:2152 length:669 start_codon:yes stop_codon:yes gene_type:complete
MINLPRINITNNKTVLIILFVGIIFYILNYLDVNKTVTMIFIILFFVYYDKVIKNTNKFFFKRKGRDENYNNRIEELLNSFKEYKHLSPYRYNEGYNMWKEFIHLLNKLESEDLYNYNQYFDNAHFYLKKSCNIFMGMTTESKERKYIDGMEYGDFENSKELKRISGIIRELYNEGYILLYNLSLRLNKNWEEDPNIHNKEIVFNVPEPHDKKNKYDNRDFF